MLVAVRKFPCGSFAGVGETEPGFEIKYYGNNKRKTKG
jgi:hypothetical protein